MYIVIYKPHGCLNCETMHIGPFDSHEAAADMSARLPAIGIYYDHEHQGQHGCKYIAELWPQAATEVLLMATTGV